VSELPLRKVPERLSSILDVESALTIRHIATFDLQYLDPSTPGIDARRRMKQDNLDTHSIPGCLGPIPGL
jgi:hypothetical protein